MTHSESPWELSYPYVLDAAGQVVCRVSPIEEETPRDVANGRLLASAPELLQKLEWCAQWMSSGDLEFVQETIDKAKGGAR